MTKSSAENRLFDCLQNSSLNFKTLYFIIQLFCTQFFLFSSTYCFFFSYLTFFSSLHNFFLITQRKAIMLRVKSCVSIYTILHYDLLMFSQQQITLNKYHHNYPSSFPASFISSFRYNYSSL